MIRLVLVAWLALCGVANAQLSGGVGGFPGPGAASGCTPGTEATNFLARTSGLNATYTNAYCNLINGLVADGFITGNLSGAASCGTGTKVLENLWILASDTSTNALLNICGTSFPPVPTNTPTFTAGVGYAGNGTTSYLAVAWAPSTNGVNFTQNCASMGAYIGNNRTTSNSSVIMGTAVPSSFAYIVPLETSNFKYDMNSATFPTVANGGTAGMWIATRTAASGAGATAAYKNGNTTAIQMMRQIRINC